MNQGKSDQEELSGEANTAVTDIMDIDRTPELLTWIFGELFGRKQQGGTGAAQHAKQGGSEGTAFHEPVIAAAPRRPQAAAAGSSSAASSSGNRTETATVGGGCFWCIEACFSQLQGIVAATSGYAGGHVANPTYQQVCSKTTGHAEVVQLVYDPAVLSFKDIMQIFMSIHDPTTPNRQGKDVGPQYRSIVMYHDEQQRAAAQEVLSEAGRDGWFARRVCTELVPLQTFYKAESVHQRYYARNPNAGYCAFVVRPKLQEFRRKYAKRLRQDEVVAL